MKDGTAHLASKAQHAVDLETGAIVAATVTHADRGDGPTGAETLVVAQAHLLQMGSRAEVKELVADKGDHNNGLLAQHAQWQVRACLPERKQQHRRWTDKPEAYEATFRANHRRVRRDKGKRLNRWRSERCERPFAHVCETGGGRHRWRRGLINVTKAHVLQCAAFNLGLLLRKAFGLGKPRSGAALFELIWGLWTALTHYMASILRTFPIRPPKNPALLHPSLVSSPSLKTTRSLTGW